MGLTKVQRAVVEKLREGAEIYWSAYHPPQLCSDGLQTVKGLNSRTVRKLEQLGLLEDRGYDGRYKVYGLASPKRKEMK